MFEFIMNQGVLHAVRGRVENWGDHGTGKAKPEPSRSAPAGNRVRYGPSLVRVANRPAGGLGTVLNLDGDHPAPRR